jgi:hypothetical protein
MKPHLMIKRGTTLYRGVCRKLDDKQNGFWSPFTSTTLNPEVAMMYAGPEGTIFEISLSKNDPHPHANISHVSKVPDEEEVILLPFFPLQEVSRRTDKSGLTFI